MQNFQHAIDATKVALNSSGSAMQENARYMESLEAKEQAVAAEFEDFANRVLSKEVVGGFLDAKQAALEFINTDFGAAATRIVGVGTAAASALGIIGTMGAKLVLVAKQLQAAGAATGILGILTSPKSLLIIGAVAAAIAGIVEAVKAVEQAQYEANHAFEIANKKLAETKDEIDSTKESLDKYRESLQQLNEVSEKNRGLDWQQERAEIEMNITAAESYLKLLEQKARLEAETAYASELPTGYTGAGSIVEQEFKDDAYYFGDYVSKNDGLVQLTEKQAKVINATYDSEYEALSAIMLVLSNVTDERYRYIEAEDIAALSGLSESEQIEQMRNKLEALGITLSATTETSTEAFNNMSNLANKTGELSQKEQELAQRYLDTYRNIVELGVATKEQTEAYIQLFGKTTGIVAETDNAAEKVALIANAFGMSVDAAFSYAAALGLVDGRAALLKDNLVVLADGTVALKDNCVQGADGVWQLKNSLDGLSDATNDAASNTTPFTSMLFDATGQLTEYGRQALQSSSALADLAVKELQASQAAAQANFSNLIAQIQAVANNALIAGQQLATMMSMAGVDFGTGDPDQFFKMRYRQTMGETAESNIAGYNKFVTDYLASRATKNFQSTMDTIKGQIDQLNQYTSTSVDGSAAKTAKNVENTAKRATDNIANYAKEQAEAVSQEIEDMFSKLRDTEEDYWDAKIDALEEQNKEIDRQVQLEEKLKALEEAKNQKVLLYKDGRFQYDTNRAAVASAQYDLNKTWIDVSLDKQKDILTKMKNGALDLIDEWKEKALEQGELTAEDINTLLGEYHDLGNAQYETVAWGTAGISNLIGTGMSVIGNAIAKSKLGQQLGLGNLNQQLANSGAFSGLYTGSDLRSGGISGATGTGGTYSYVGGGGTAGTGSLADLLNKNFGAGLTEVSSGKKKVSESFVDFVPRYNTTTWLGRNLNEPSSQLTQFTRKGETQEETQANLLEGIRQRYVEDARKFGAGIAWWIQRMDAYSDIWEEGEGPGLGPGALGVTKRQLRTTDWQAKAFEAKSTPELIDYMERAAAQKILNFYNEEDLNEWYDKTSLDAYRALYFRDPEAAIGNLYTNPSYRLYDALLFSKYFGKEGEIPDFEAAGKPAFSSAFAESGPWSRRELEQAVAVGSAGMSEWATAKILELSVKSQLDQLEAIDKQLEENDERQKTVSGEELKQLRLLNKELTGTRKDIIENFGKYETGVASWDVYGQPTVEREERWATDEELEAIGVTRPSRAKALQAQIDALSAAWWETDDPAEKAKLHRQAEALRAELAEEALQTAGSDASDAMEIDGTPMTDEERYDMMRVQLAENSKAWFDASDAEKARLHDENEAIRRQLEDAGQSYARGTTYARGGLSLVGEDGPEMRVLGKGDGIIPSDVTSNLWKFGQNPHMFMRSYGQSLSNMFNISNLTLPNVHDAQSLVSGLERMAHQYVAQRS